MATKTKTPTPPTEVVEAPAETIETTAAPTETPEVSSEVSAVESTEPDLPSHIEERDINGQKFLWDKVLDGPAFTCPEQPEPPVTEESVAEVPEGDTPLDAPQDTP